MVARISVFGEAGHARYLEELAERGVRREVAAGGVVRFERNGVAVQRGHAARTCARTSRRRSKNSGRT